MIYYRLSFSVSLKHCPCSILNTIKTNTKKINIQYKKISCYIADGNNKYNIYFDDDDIEKHQLKFFKEILQEILKDYYIGSIKITKINNEIIFTDLDD